MIHGRVTADGVPQVSLAIAGTIWSAVVDSAFNGDLELPEALRSSIKARFLAATEWILAADQRIIEDLYEVALPFDGRVVSAEATFVAGDSILIGTGLLTQVTQFATRFREFPMF